MFRMLGNKVELIRYIIKYVENDEEMEERCISENHKDLIESKLTKADIEYTTETIDQDGNEWIDGFKFESFDKAQKSLENGEQAYLLGQEQKLLTDNLRLRADIDFIAIMSGVEI